MFEAVNCPLVALGPAGDAQHRTAQAFLNPRPATIDPIVRPLTPVARVPSDQSGTEPVADVPEAGSAPVEVDSPQAGAPAPGRAAAVKRIPMAVLAFGAVSLLTDLSTEAVNAVLPLYLTAVLGLGPLAYGFIDGLYQGVSAAVRILGGWWSDVSRRPKWVSFVGYAMSAVSKIALLFGTGFTVIASVVAVDRLGKGIRSGPRDALLASASTPERLGRNFGVHRALDTVGASLGPLAAFAILAAIPWGAGGYHTVFVMSAGVAILGLIVLVTAVPDLRGVSRKVKEWGRWPDLRTPGMIRLYIVAGLLGLGTIGDGFIYLTLSQKEAVAAQYFPLLFVGTNAAFLALSVPLGRLADRIGRATVFIGGHVALLVMYVVLLSGSPSLGWVIGVLALSGCYYAATDGVISALTAQVVGERSRASGISATQTIVALARFGSSIGFGLLWQLWGSTAAVATIAVLLAVAVSCSFVLLRPWLRRVAA
jgi:MFS family permease